MDGLSQEACKVANKVALSMLYGETTGRRIQAGQMVQEAFDSTCGLLDRLDPSELRTWFEQFHNVFDGFHQTLIDDPAAWSQFLGSQCDQLHEVGLHQKTIAGIGDELAQWGRGVVSYEEFANGLNGLASLVTDHSQRLGTAIEQQAGSEAKSQRRSTLFAHCVCGLTVVLVAINQAIELGDPRDKNCAALASFGATLTIDSVAKLFKACELNWV